MAYLLWLQSLRVAAGDVFDGFFNFVSSSAVGALGFLVPAIVLWCVSKEAGTFLLFNLGTGSAVNQLAKNICCVYRPWILNSDIHPSEAALPGATGYSFPSGHTQIATAVFGSIAVWWKRRKGLVVACVAAIALVAFSRNYLGVHMPQDVLASIALCSLVIWGNWYLMKWVERHPERDVWVLVGALAFAVAMLLFCCLKSYPLDYVDGVLLVDPERMIDDCFKSAGLLAGVAVGWFVDRRCLRYTIEGTRKQKAVRLLGGLVLGGVLFACVLMPLGTLLGPWWGNFALTFLAMLYVVLGYPAVFSAMRRQQEKRQAGALRLG